MKKVLITFVAFLTTLNIMAQDLLTFKGIPIEGSLAEFKKKLKTNDFIWVGHGKDKRNGYRHVSAYRAHHQTKEC